MYLNQADPLQHLEHPARRSRLRFIPAGALGVLAAYGLGTHHVLLVAFGLLAALAFSFRVQQAGGSVLRSTREAFDRHADGGAIKHPGDTSLNPGSRPTVIDGGSGKRAGQA